MSTKVARDMKAWERTMEALHSPKYGEMLKQAIKEANKQTEEKKTKESKDGQ